MMKWILAILLFVSGTAIGQTEDTTKYIKYQNQYGQQLPRIWAPRILRLPYKDTASEHPTNKPGAIMMGLDKNIYKWDSLNWVPVGGVSPSDTTNKWINDIRRSNDSVYAFKNGSWQFKYIDSTGGGAGSVTSVAQRRDTLLYNDGTEQVVSIGEKFIGQIYNDDSWANLNDFIEVGTTNWTVSGDSIQGSGGGGNFSQTLNLNVGPHDTTNLQKWKMSANFRPGSTPSGTTFGFGLGIRSTNDSHRYNVAGQFDATNLSTGGKLMIYSGVDSAVLVTSTNAVAFSAGDEINLTVEQYDNNLTVSARNITTNSATVTATYIYEYQTGAVMHNTGQFAVYSFGGNFSFDSLAVESAEIKNANVLVLTDSKGAGYSAGSFGESWANLLSGRYKTVVNVAGGSDATPELITRISEVLALKPKQVLLQIPSNDIRYSVVDATSHANYERIVKALHDVNIPVYHLLPAYETSIDLSAQAAYIRATFSADSIINVWDPTHVNGTLFTDGIHPNTFGHQVIFNSIVSSNKLYGAHVPMQMAGVYGYLPKFTGPTSLGISHLYDDNTFINSILNHNVSNASPRIYFNETDGATNGKVWGVAVDGNNFDLRLFNDAYDPTGATGFRLNRTTTTVNYAQTLAPLGVNMVPGASIMLNVNGTSQLEGMTRMKGAADKNLEVFSAGGDMYMFSINDARNSSPTNTILAAGTNLIFQDYTTGSQVERARFSGNNLQIVGDATVADEAYDATNWNGNLEVPTKNAVRDKIESLGGGNGIYGGNGTLPSDVTVTGANNSITFNDIFAYRINSDYNVIAKANGTGIYSEAVIGTGNIYEIGYTPTPGVFSKGAGVFIDTNVNVGIGAQPPTTMPLYATGASLFVQGLQSNQGNFMRVDNVATTGSLGMTNYFITIDATAGNVTLTLPAASTAFGNSMGIKYVVQRIDNSGNTITIQRAGSDTINGTTSFTLGTQWESKNIQCTSTSTWAQH